MKRKNVIAVVIIILIFAVFITLVVIRLHNYTHIKNVEWVEYVIQPGDTLWTIVERNDNYDIRVIIDEVKAHNNIDENLIPYTVIELPDWD